MDAIPSGGIIPGMNKNKNKDQDNYLAVIRALQRAKVEDEVDGYVRLYITKKNGLANIPFSELERTIISLKNDGCLELNHAPSQSDLHKSSKPVYDHTSEKKELWRKLKVLDDYSRPVWPRNYFSLTLEPKFDERFSSSPPPIFLLSAIPIGTKTKNHIRITKLLIERGKVPNSLIAMKTSFKHNGVVYRPTKKRYDQSPATFNKKIKNALKTLRERLKPHGYEIKFSKNFTELIQTPPDNSTKAK